MSKRAKANIICVAMILAVLGENYLAYNSFGGSRGYVELLFCGFFLHLIVAGVVLAILEFLIPERSSSHSQVQSSKSCLSAQNVENTSDGRIATGLDYVRLAELPNPFDGLTVEQAKKLVVYFNLFAPIRKNNIELYEEYGDAACYTLGIDELTLIACEVARELRGLASADW